MENRLQLILDTCGVHLLTQKERSAFLGKCAYFHNNLSCAAQPLLNDLAKIDKDKAITRKHKNPDSVFSSGTLNYITIDEVPELYFKDEFKGLTDEELEFAREIQRIHDASDIGFWKTRLMTLAKNYDLSTEKLEAIE